MVKLSANNIQAIEEALNENTVVEVHLTVEGVLVTTRPTDTCDHTLEYPMLVSSEEPTLLMLMAKNSSAPIPVMLVQFNAPKGYHFKGINGYVDNK